MLSVLEPLRLGDLFRTMIPFTSGIAKIFGPLFGPVVSLNPAFAEEVPESLLAHPGELASLPERKHLLSVEGNGKLALELFFLPTLGKGQCIGDRARNRKLKVL
jgi:hypothetical protein